MEPVTKLGFDAWKHAVSSSFVSLLTETEHRGNFSGFMNISHHETLTLTSLSAGPHKVTRTSALIHNDKIDRTAGYYKVSLQTQGHGVLRQDGREVVLEPGSLAIYDTSRPYTLHFDSDFSSHILLLPYSQIAFPQDGIRELTATSLGSDRDLGKMSAQMLAQAAKVVPKLDQNLGDRVANNVVDLINTLIADELLTFSAGALNSRNREIARVKNFIDRHLSDFALDPSTIAAAHHISVRALHYLFEGEAESVTDLIRNRRIEKAKQDLADPLQQEVPVAIVASRWGFPDPAYFSRVFRKAVGLAPTKYRYES